MKNYFKFFHVVASAIPHSFIPPHTPTHCAMSFWLANKYIISLFNAFKVCVCVCVYWK